ncbi:hypothetical protein [Kribbella jejuensis]|uniref:hypothetical protein n=1 Tax=Kribbella jejuensis TaxID=236068 RepID=UPI00115222E6|nr:hypothetical protein [Kribbella jejuensis]
MVIRLSQSGPAERIANRSDYRLPEQQWSYSVAAEFAGKVPEVIAPLVASDGEAAFVWHGRPITVWPFVMGASLDRRNSVELRRAAHLLARCCAETGGSWLLLIGTRLNGAR